MFCYVTDYNTPIVQDVYQRKLVKLCVMATLYGATDFGRHGMFMSTFFSLCLAQGLYVSDRQFFC